MYESPISVYIEQAVEEIKERRDAEIIHTIKERCNIDVNRAELIKALNYDRQQYDKGYADGLSDYKEAITNQDFLKCNYGLSTVDIYFLNSFNPSNIIRDYKEWKYEQERRDNK